MLVAYDVALDLIRALRPMIAQLRGYSPEAADQIERAASSIVLNLAEGIAVTAEIREGSSTWRTVVRERSAARWTSRMRGLADREHAGACTARSRAGSAVGPHPTRSSQGSVGLAIGGQSADLAARRMTEHCVRPVSISRNGVGSGNSGV